MICPTCDIVVEDRLEKLSRSYVLNEVAFLQYSIQYLVALSCFVLFCAGAGGDRWAVTFQVPYCIALFTIPGLAYHYMGCNAIHTRIVCLRLFLAC